MNFKLSLFCHHVEKVGLNKKIEGCVFQGNSNSFLEVKQYSTAVLKNQQTVDIMCLVYF